MARYTRHRRPHDGNAPALDAGQLASSSMFEPTWGTFAKEEMTVVAPVQRLELYPREDAIADGTLRTRDGEHEHDERFLDAARA